VIHDRLIELLDICVSFLFANILCGAEQKIKTKDLSILYILLFLNLYTSEMLMYYFISVIIIVIEYWFFELNSKNIKKYICKFDFGSSWNQTLETCSSLVQ
jgi:hypothetical protein